MTAFSISGKFFIKILRVEVLQLQKLHYRPCIQYKLYEFKKKKLYSKTIWATAHFAL